METSQPSSGRLLVGFVQRRGAGYLVIVVGIGGCILGIVLLPDLGHEATRAGYKDFFTASSAVAIGIFVTLAVASRDVTSDILLGVVTVVLVGIAALASVLDLLPRASTTLYKVAFVALVGGGLAGLVSTALIAAVSLFTARADRYAALTQELKALRETMTK
jgi:hypothetical protein